MITIALNGLPFSVIQNPAYDKRTLSDKKFASKNPVKNMKKSEILFGLLKIPFDFFATILAFLIAYRLRLSADLIPGFNFPYNPEELVSVHEYFSFGVIASLAFVGICALNGLYALKTTYALNKELGKTFMSGLAWLTLIIVYFFVIREFPYSRLALAYTWALTILFSSFGKILLRHLQKFFLKKGFGRRRTLIIGSSKLSYELITELGKNLSYQIVGVIDEPNKREELEEAGIKYLGNITELERICKNRQIDEIIQTKNHLAETAAEEILAFCREHHLQYNFVPDLLETKRSNIAITTINNIPIISLKPTPLDGWGKVIKRIFDIIGSVFGLIISSPILLLSAIAIKWEDPKGTILFKYLDDGSVAQRVGQQGKFFHCYKLRSMKPGTHELRYNELAEQNLRKGTPLVKIKDDPRVTKVGRFIRKTSIDELPSLWNVIKGEMSLVGPRPHLPEEVEKYQRHHKFALTIKPGVTGLAQISGRSDLNFEDEIKLDTFYIEHWSLWLDIKIIFKTFAVLIKGYRE